MDGAPNEAPQVSEEETVKRDFLRDYKLSFKFSQNGVELQDLLLLYMAQNSTPGQIQTILGSSNELLGKANDMRIPTQHSNEEINKDRTSRQFGGILKGYFNMLIAMQNGDSIPDTPSGSGDLNMDSFNSSEREVLLEEITLRMLKKDAQFVEKGRPNRLDRDPHESMIRAHAFSGETTGSPLFNQLFGEINQLLVSLKDYKPTGDGEIPYQGMNQRPNDPGIRRDALKVRSDILEAAYNNTHPGQSFFPGEAIAA